MIVTNQKVIWVMSAYYQSVKMHIMKKDHHTNNGSNDLNQKCRICGGDVSLYGSQTVLGKYDVSYFKCNSCLSLQSEQPFWLDEAYGNHIPNFDTGYCERNIQLVLECTALFRELRFDIDTKYLDYGAGTGMFARMMRDRGFDFRSYDKFSNCRLNYGFSVTDPFEFAPSVITAFEVFEHLVNPADEIGALLEADLDALIFTTGVFNDQGMDWPYLVPDKGQHISFCSKKALTLLAGDRYVFLSTGLIMAFFSRKTLKARLDEGFNIEMTLSQIRSDPNGWTTHCLHLFADHLKDPLKFIQQDLAEIITSTRETRPGSHEEMPS